jgi:peptidoglycan/LPS O-acetylase OafA/YrhL
LKTHGNPWVFASNTFPFVKKHIENLDSLRFIAFFAVFLSHCLLSPPDDAIVSSDTLLQLKFMLKQGVRGMDFFFVLSGFIISWQGIQEWAITGGFHLKAFYRRRMFRIFPLYFVIIAGYLFFRLCYNVPSLQEIPFLGLERFFTINFYLAYSEVSFLFCLMILWSIAIEIQFYLIWGLVLRYLHKHLLLVTSIMILCSAVFIGLYFGNSRMLYYHSLRYLGHFGVGGAVAFILIRFPLVLDRWKKLSTISIFLIYCTAILMFYGTLLLPVTRFSSILENLLATLIFGFIIVEQAFCEQSLFKVGDLPFLEKLGKYSYGLYIYHGLVITAFIGLERYFSWEEGLRIYVVYPLTMLLITIFCAWISYEFFEKKFLRG